MVKNQSEERAVWGGQQGLISALVEKPADRDTVTWIGQNELKLAGIESRLPLSAKNRQTKK